MDKDKIRKLAYGINYSQIILLRTIMYLGRPTIKDLLERLNSDRTTMQKNLKVLFDKSYITRTKQNLNRGYCYKYQSNDKHIVESVKKFFFEIESYKKDFIDEFDNN